MSGFGAVDAAHVLAAFMAAEACLRAVCGCLERVDCRDTGYIAYSEGQLFRLVVSASHPVQVMQRHRHKAVYAVEEPGGPQFPGHEPP